MPAQLVRNKRSDTPGGIRSTSDCFGGLPELSGRATVVRCDRRVASRIARSSSIATQSSTRLGSADGPGTWMLWRTTRTGPSLGEWLACQALFRQVAEHPVVQRDQEPVPGRHRYQG